MHAFIAKAFPASFLTHIRMVGSYTHDTRDNPLFQTKQLQMGPGEQVFSPNHSTIILN